MEPDYKLYGGSVKDAKTEAERFIAAQRALGLSDRFIVDLLVGGSDESIRKNDPDGSVMEERNRLKEINRNAWRERHPEASEEEVEKRMEPEPEPDDTEEKISEAVEDAGTLFKKIFTLDPLELFKPGSHFPEYNREYVERFEKWCEEVLKPETKEPLHCIVSGLPQVGKTHAVKKMFYALALTQFKPYYQAVSNMNGVCDILRYANGREDFMYHYDGMMRNLQQADILFVDEFGMERESHKERIFEWLYRMLEYRNERNRPTCFITNMSIQAIKDYYDERIVSRIRAKGVKQITFDPDNAVEFETWRKSEA